VSYAGYLGSPATGKGSDAYFFIGQSECLYTSGVKWFCVLTLGCVLRLRRELELKLYPFHCTRLSPPNILT